MGSRDVEVLRNALREAHNREHEALTKLVVELADRVLALEKRG